MKIYDSISQWGWTGLAAAAAQAGGSVFYVDSNSGNKANAASTGQGASWDLPFANVNYAISRCSNNANDVILVAPGHTETIADTNASNVSGTTTDEFCVDKAGITIIGLGNGRRAPLFTLATATDACIDVRNADCSMYNLRFYNTIDGNVSMLDAQAGAHGLLLEGCTFSASANTAECITTITLTTGITDVTIRGCRLSNVAGGDQALAAINCEGVVTRLKLYDNYIRGDYNEHLIDGDAAAGFDVEIVDNVFDQIDAAVGEGLDLHASTTGIVIGNVTHAGKNGTNPYAVAGCVTRDNWYTNAEGARAALQGTADDS